MYNQNTRGMATTRHRSLVERGGRKALLETLHTHTTRKTEKTCQEKPIFTNLKKRFECIELPAKLLVPLLQPDLFAQLLSGFKDQTVAASELGVDVSLPFASAHRIAR